MKTNELLLSVENLTVKYHTDEETVHAVNNVSFPIYRGETLGLIGETGAGKTTIAKAIMRILPDPPAKVTQGSIFYEDTDLLQLSERKMRAIRGKEISMIFQDPMTALNPALTVGRQIAESFEQHENLSRRQARERAIEILETVGILASRYDEYPHQFSGGMKQRVVIAMALACNPNLLLADEPTTALDVTIQAQILDLIHKLNREHNTSMLLITHDFGIVAEFCDRVAVIYAGEIVEYGTLIDLFDHPMHPYTRGLFASLPHIEKKVHRLKPIPGMIPDPTNLPEGCCFRERCEFCVDACARKPEVADVGGGHIVRCVLAKER